jgi:hypothetical protein
MARQECRLAGKCQGPKTINSEASERNRQLNKREKREDIDPNQTIIGRSIRFLINKNGTECEGMSPCVSQSPPIQALTRLEGGAI